LNHPHSKRTGGKDSGDWKPAWHYNGNLSAKGGDGLRRNARAFAAAALIAVCGAFVHFTTSACAEDLYTWGEWAYAEGQFLRQALPPVPLPGSSTFVGQDGQWFRLLIVPDAKPEPIETPPEAAALGLPGKPFFWGPWVISSGRRLRVLFPFPEFQEGGYLVHPSGKWYEWDDARKRLRSAPPLEGYILVKPGK